MNAASESFIKIHDENIPALTGLRAFAALWVFVLHACYGEVNQYGFFTAFDHKLDWGIFENFILMEGNPAVSLFFILSGFIMAHVYGHHFKDSIRPKLAVIFYLKRLARIYPVHLFITLVLAALFFTGTWQPMRPFDLQGVLLSAGLLNVFEDPSTNIPAWSVSAEWIAYLACPFLLFLLAKVKSGKFDLLAIALLCVAYPYLFKEFFCCTGTSGGGAILKVMTDFIIGCFLYRLYTRKDFVLTGKNGNDWMCLSGFAILFGVSLFWNKFEVTHSILPFILFYLASSSGFMKDFFASRVMIFLGVISYCIYMVHYPVLEFFTHFYSDFMSDLPEDYSQVRLWLFFGVMTSAVIGAATLLYYSIERPCRLFIVNRARTL